LRPQLPARPFQLRPANPPCFRATTSALFRVGQSSHILESDLIVKVTRRGIHLALTVPLPVRARLLVWLTEGRLWATDQPVFSGLRGPLSRHAIYKLLERYARRKP
jgi:hypothetical protein